jgi:hypothetical protein
MSHLIKAMHVLFTRGVHFLSNLIKCHIWLIIINVILKNWTKQNKYVISKMKVEFSQIDQNLDKNGQGNKLWQLEKPCIYCNVITK